MSAPRKTRPRQRRPLGEGGLSQRADGRWMGRIYLGEKPTGDTVLMTSKDGTVRLVPKTRRIEKTIYGRTQAEVVEKLRAERNRVKDGLQPTRPRWTVAELLDEWLKRLDRIGEVRPSTIDNYRHVIRPIVAAIGHIKVIDITRDDVERMLQGTRVAVNRPADTVDYVYRPASDSYRRRAKSVLTAALNDAIEQGHVARNVASLAKVRKADLAHEGRTLTTAQVATLLNHVYGHPLEVFIVAGITLGLRGGETCALRWGDVNFRAGTVAITGTLVREGSRLVKTEPKTPLSRATLDMPGLLADARRHHPRHRRRP